MKKYLLDTNICSYFLKGLLGLDQKIKTVGLANCAISELTIAELKFGVENNQSLRKEQIRNMVEKFLSHIQIVPLITSYDFYASEKVRLRKEGKTVDEFDLLIGCTAVVNGRILVTNNEKHFQNIAGIEIENWVK